MSKNKNDESGLFKQTWFKVTVALLLIVCASWYCWGKYHKFTKGLPPDSKNQGQTAMVDAMLEGQRPSPDQMRAMMQEEAKKLNLTAEQKVKFDKLLSGPMPDKPEDWRARRDEMNQILTADQQAQMQQDRRARMQMMMQQAAKVLSPQDLSALQQRMAARRGGGGRRRGQ